MTPASMTAAALAGAFAAAVSAAGCAGEAGLPASGEAPRAAPPPAPRGSVAGSSAESPPELAAKKPPATLACPEDMVEIDGEYCTKIEQVCLRRRKHRQCAEFQPPSLCSGPAQRMRYCIDRYEYPNRRGEVPTVMNSWKSAKASCAAAGKRLCTEDEWTLACEGPERLPFPYGFVRDPTACSIDKPSPRVDEGRLYFPRTQAAELARVDQREPSGSRERCVSAYGVYDLTGNVDELVTNETGRPFKSALKGGSWGEYRNACRPSTRGHDEAFRYYQTGFRCCRAADGD